MNTENRVLARLLALEVPAAELEQIAGGTGNPSPSYSGPTSASRQDDVTTDDF